MTPTTEHSGISIVTWLTCFETYGSTYLFTAGIHCVSFELFWQLPADDAAFPVTVWEVLKMLKKMGKNAFPRQLQITAMTRFLLFVEEYDKEGNITVWSYVYTCENMLDLLINTLGLVPNPLLHLACCKLFTELSPLVTDYNTLWVNCSCACKSNLALFYTVVPLNNQAGSASTDRDEKYDCYRCNRFKGGGAACPEARRQIEGIRLLFHDSCFVHVASPWQCKYSKVYIKGFWVYTDVSRDVGWLWIFSIDWL